LPKKTFECADLAGAKLITQVKGNQKALLGQIKHGCKIQKPVDTIVEDWEKSHGRLEQRGYEVFSALPMLNKWQEDWSYIQNIIRVTRFRQRLYGGEEPSQEVTYYASNASFSAQEYSQYIRQHWFVENKMHHVKDVSFQEDKTVKRVNPFIFSACIDFSLNRLRKNKDMSIKQKIYQSSLNVFSFLEDNKYFDLISTP